MKSVQALKRFMLTLLICPLSSKKRIKPRWPHYAGPLIAFSLYYYYHYCMARCVEFISIYQCVCRLYENTYPWGGLEKMTKVFDLWGEDPLCLWM